MSVINVNNPIFDMVYPIQAWEDNNRTLKLVQGEGVTIPDNATATTTIQASRVKAPRFQLKSKQGAIDLSSGSPTITWAVQRPNNSGEDLLTCNIVSGKAAEGIIEVPITTSVTEFAGDAYGEIRVTTSSAVIKFFGINACIGTGVSDDAASQSSRYNALLDALQQVVALKNSSGNITINIPEGEEVPEQIVVSLIAQMATLDSNGDLKTGSSGSNPVSSDNLNTYLKSNYLNYLKARFTSFKYAHEAHSSGYDPDENPVDVYDDTTFEGVYIDNATDSKTIYIIKNSGGAQVGILIPAVTNSLSYGAVQVALYYTGAFKYRRYHGSPLAWDEWASIEIQSNKDLYDAEDTTYFGISNEASRYPSSKSIRKAIDAIFTSLRDVSILGAKAFDPDKTYNIHKDLVATYLENSDYSDDTGYTRSALTDFDFGFETHGRPNKVSLTIPTGGVKIEYHDTVTGKMWVEGTTSDSISYINGVFYIQNLIPNHLYTYVIYDENDSILKTGTCLASGQVRMISAGGDTFNIRDLGGWECDGGHIKYDKIYRGAELNYGITITAAQQQFIKSVFGITDEIDLRVESGIPSDTALGVGVSYSHFPLEYGDIVVSNDSVFKPAAVIKHIANNLKNGKTSYIHCRAGADRTGTICLLLEAICGVSQNDIDRDYELTSFSIQPNYGNTRALRKRTDTRVVTGVGDYAPKATFATFNDMEGTSLQDKIIRFLLRNGVTIDEINDIRFGLIDGNPTKITSPYGTASVTKSLTNVSIDNSATTTTLYQPYTAQLLVDGGYVLDNVVLTMGNSDASIYYNNGIINIPIVTGNISITATAARIGAVGATYTLLATDWVGATNATQTVDLSSAYSITQNTKVDIDIDINTMRQLQVDECQCLIIESTTENGATTLKAVAYGGKPTTDIVVHLIISEVNELSLSGGDNE